MRLASKKTVGKRLLPLMMAAVLALIIGLVLGSVAALCRGSPCRRRRLRRA